jgi:hypothetical protein
LNEKFGGEMKLLYEDFNKINWDRMPFSRKFAENALVDKIDGPKGYLKIQAFEHKNEPNGKLIYEDGNDNQIMYWLKHSFAMLEGGIFFSDSGEHLGYNDGASTLVQSADHPPTWFYNNLSGNWIYSTHAWASSVDSLAIGVGAGSIASGAKLYPFFPTKMRFGTAGPVDVSTPIDPSDINLEDVNAQGAGNQAPPKLNFILIERTTHVTLTTTGFSLTAPTGYYADFGSRFKNITVYQVTMPASAPAFDYDGKTLNEAGIFCDAALTGTQSSLHEMPNGMILAKRYFSPIQKTNTISINFQWSIVK